MTTDGGSVAVLSIYHEDELIFVTNEFNFLSGRYFGVWSSAEDKTFTQTHVDWIKIESIDWLVCNRWTEQAATDVIQGAYGHVSPSTTINKLWLIEDQEVIQTSDSK